MCEPGTLMMAATVITGGIQAYGQIEQGNAAYEAAQYQAQVERNNAISERNKAIQERQKGEQEATQKRREVARIIGQQRANVGASGVEMTGSPLDVLEDTALQGALDVAMIRHNAEIRARDREFSAQNFDAQSELTMMSGRAARRAGMISALGTVVSTGSSVAGQWQQNGSPFGSGKKGKG